MARADDRADAACGSSSSTPAAALNAGVRLKGTEQITLMAWTLTAGVATLLAAATADAVVGLHGADARR